MKDKRNDDMDLFDDESEDLITEAARHLRTCSNCREHLKATAKPAAKYALAEVERELDRPLTPEEKKILAKTTAVIISRGMALTARMVADAAIPLTEAIEQALAEGKMLQTPYNSPVGEA
jgi:predicted anti-sigma-YlaC factor YlaD